MDHILTVGEIYDKAIDLCLRNAGKVALTLGTFFLVTNTVYVLGSSFIDENKALAAMHLRLHVSNTSSGPLNVSEYLASFILLPIVGAALGVLFDSRLRGESVALKVCFGSPIRRAANIIVASFACYIVVIPAALALGCLISVVGNIHRLVIFDLAIAALGLLLACISVPLTIGVTIGFARVALDAGRVLDSMKFGIKAALARGNRRLVSGVGLPLLFLFALGSFGGVYAGLVVFGLTGSDVAYVIMLSAGDVFAVCILAAVATVFYRNLKSAA